MPHEHASVLGLSATLGTAPVAALQLRPIATHVNQETTSATDHVGGGSHPQSEHLATVWPESCPPSGSVLNLAAQHVPLTRANSAWSGTPASLDTSGLESARHGPATPGGLAASRWFPQNTTWASTLGLPQPTTR